MTVKDCVGTCGNCVRGWFTGIDFMTVSPNASGNRADGNRAATSPVMLDVDQFGELLGVSARHVRRLVDAGKAPQPVRLGGCVRWPRPNVEAWIADGCPKCRKQKGGAK